jgi:uncharacterized protein (TIGR03437 family)
VAASVTPNPVVEAPANSQGYNWYCTITLQEQAGVATTLTKFAVSGLGSGSGAGTVPGNFTQDLSGSILQLFGTAAIPAHGQIVATYGTNNIAPPETVIFGFTGMDANGYPWFTTYTVAFNGPGRAIGSLVNGASFQASSVPYTSTNPPPDAPPISEAVFAPGMIMTVLANNPQTLSNFTSTGSLPLPPALVGSDGSSFFSATIGGLPAPLFYVSPNQINLQVPYELQSSLAAATATTAGTPVVLLLNNSGVQSSFSFLLQPVAPGIFVSNGVQNGTGGSNSASNPAPAGSAVTIYFTGAGAVSPGIVDGYAAIAGAEPVPASKATVTIRQNGTVVQTFSNASAANSTVAVKMAAGTVGVAEAQFTLPDAGELPPGNYTISISLQATVGSGAAAQTLSATSNEVPLVIGP